MKLQPEYQCVMNPQPKRIKLRSQKMVLEVRLVKVRSFTIGANGKKIWTGADCILPVVKLRRKK